MRLAALCALMLGVGTTLVLAELRWFSRPSLTERLRPYTPGAARDARPSGVLSVATLRDVVAPLAVWFGAALSRASGVGEDLSVRLARVGADADPTAFRTRQLGWTVAGFGAGAVLAVAAQPPAAVGVVLALGPPALAFLAVEQGLAARTEAWRRRVVLELPVVAEQLGMLLSAGYSVGAAIARLASRQSGAVGRDLQRVVERVRQGLSDTEALREWAARAGIAEVHALVAVLALDRDAGDLGRLVSEEARSVRREVQRQQLALMERRAQQVWIPVTVATLAPGALFLAVPFVEAMRAFSGG